jgi:hypothetical protein
MVNIWVLSAAGEFLTMSDRAQGFEDIQTEYAGSNPVDQRFKIIDETETRYVNENGVVEQMSTPQFIGGVIFSLLEEDNLSPDVWTTENVSVLNMYIGGALARRRYQQAAIYEASIYARESTEGLVIDAKQFTERLKSL